MYAGAIADIEGVVATCEEALSKAEEMAGVRAGEVVIGIAGELIKGNTASIKYRRADASRPITDAEMENTPRITFKTPKGKETVYVNTENLINRIYEERTVNNNIFIEFDRLAEIIRHFGEVNADEDSD
jgi:cell division ATPase FtsA